MIFAGRDGFIVRIRDKAGGSAGIGFLVGERHVVTCAHVVNTALGRADKASQEGPGQEERLQIDFPLLDVPAGNSTCDCRAECWVPPPRQGVSGGDVAGLVIVGGELPKGAGPARLIRTDRASGLEVGVFGYAGGSREDRNRDLRGAWVTLRLRGAVEGGDIQLDTETESPFRAQPGYSGSPVVTRMEDEDVVAGMLNAAHDPRDPRDRRDVSAIPVARIAAAWPDMLGTLDLLATPGALSGTGAAGVAGQPLAPAPSLPQPATPPAAMADPGTWPTAQQPTAPQPELSQPSLPQVIAGNWRIDIQSQQGGSMTMMLALVIPPAGQPQFQGTFLGTQMPMQVYGYWWVMGSQLRLTGVQTVAGAMPIQYPYDVMVTFASWSHTELIGVSSNGERVIWQRQN